MKTLVVLSALVAVAMARPGFLGAPAIAAGPAIAVATVPQPPANIIIGPGGVPLDTPEVAAARGAHLATVAQTRARDAVVNSVPVLAAQGGLAVAAHGVAPSIAALGVAGIAGQGLIAPSIAALGGAGIAGAGVIAGGIAPSIAALGGAGIAGPGLIAPGIAPSIAALGPAVAGAPGALAAAAHLQAKAALLG